MKMKAGCLVEPKRYVVVDVPMPEVQEGQVLLRVVRAALCGSDLHFFHNRPALQHPCRPGFSGHEAVGIVEHSTVPMWNVGDRALVIFGAAQTNCAFAEYLSATPAQLIPLPEGIPFDELVLAQQLGTVLYAWRKMESVVDKVVAVLGQGPAGLMFSNLARNAGARSVIGIDVVPHRLALGARIGCDSTIHASETDPVEALADLTCGEMADVAIEAVGEAETIETVWHLIRTGGDLLIFGIPPLGRIPIDFWDFFRRYARTLTVANAQNEPGFRSFRLAVDMVRRGVFDVSLLISHVLPLEDIQRAFLLADAKSDGAVKVLLDTTA